MLAHHTTTARHRLLILTFVLPSHRLATSTRSLPTSRGMSLALRTRTLSSLPHHTTLYGGDVGAIMVTKLLVS